MFLLVIVAILSTITAARADTFAECNAAAAPPPLTFVASDESCSRYIFCDGDNSYEGECGDGDYFNEIYQTCDPKDLVACRIAGEQQEEDVDVEINNNVPIITPESITSNNNSNNNNNNNNNNNSNNSTAIVVSPPVVNLPQVTAATGMLDLNTTTETPLTSNNNTNVTNPINTAPPITGPAVTVLSTASTPPLLLTACPAVDNPRSMVFLSNPRSCSDYFICHHGEPIPMHCSPMLHFNVKSGKCDYAENVKCRTDFSRDQCQAHTVDLYPHPGNCNYFYYCKNGYLMLQQCPFYFGWDYERRACVKFSQAKCYSNNRQKRL